jgi:uroporphyrinogen decarboxylase
MPFVGGAIRIIRRELPLDIPLIGFAGAPFTLAAYAIEGGASRNYVNTKTLMLGDSGAWRALMERLTKQITQYLLAQIEWGVQAVQLFDSWVGCLDAADYREFVLPYVRQIIAGVREGVRHIFGEPPPKMSQTPPVEMSQTPIIYFGTGTAMLLEDMMNTAPDVLGVDWQTPLARGWEVGSRAVQGNLDPVSLFAPRDVVLRKAAEVLAAAKGRAGHIFNLGHGILPKTPVDNVKALVEFVQSGSRQDAK